MEKMTVKQVAALYDVGHRTVINWINRGLISGERVETPVGSYYLIHPDSLKAFKKPRRGRSRIPIKQKLKAYKAKLEAEAI